MSSQPLRQNTIANSSRNDFDVIGPNATRTISSFLDIRSHFHLWCTSRSVQATVNANSAWPKLVDLRALRSANFDTLRFLSCAGFASTIELSLNNSSVSVTALISLLAGSPLKGLILSDINVTDSLAVLPAVPASLQTLSWDVDVAEGEEARLQQLYKSFDVAISKLSRPTRIRMIATVDGRVEQKTAYELCFSRESFSALKVVMMGPPLSANSLAQLGSLCPELVALYACVPISALPELARFKTIGTLKLFLFQPMGVAAVDVDLSPLSAVKVRRLAVIPAASSRNILRFNDSGLAGLSNCGIQVLKLIGSVSANVTMLISRLRDLEELMIDNCYAPGSTIPRLDVLGSLKRLNSLTLGAGLSANDLEQIATFSGLTHLSITATPPPTAMQLACLRNMKLTRLALGISRRGAVFCEDSLFGLMANKHISALELLCSDRVSDECVIMLLKCMPNIKEITLFDVHSTNRRTLEDFCKTQPDLKLAVRLLSSAQIGPL